MIYRLDARCHNVYVSVSRNGKNNNSYEITIVPEESNKPWEIEHG